MNPTGKKVVFAGELALGFAVMGPLGELSLLPRVLAQVAGAGKVEAAAGRAAINALERGAAERATQTTLTDGRKMGAEAVEGASGWLSKEPGLIPRTLENGELVYVQRQLFKEFGEYACGPTAAAMLARQFRPGLEEAALRKAAQGLESGSNQAELAGMLGKLGLRTEVRNVRQISAIKADLVKGNVIADLAGPQGQKHWVIVDGIQQVAGHGEMVAIRDPATGMAFFMGLERFAAEYGGQIINVMK